MTVIHLPYLDIPIKETQVIVVSETKAILLFEKDNARSWTYFNPQKGEVLIGEY